MLEKLNLTAPLKHPIRSLKTAGMIYVWITSYFYAQRDVDPEKAYVIESKVDDRVKPDPQGTYPYILEYIYVLFIALYLMDNLSGKDFNRTYHAFRDMIMEAIRVFREFPTRMRDRDRIDFALLKFVQEIDGETNCYPSLHVGLVGISYLIVSGMKDPDEIILRGSKEVFIDVSRSTMLTKQHSMLDVVGGLELSRRSYMKYFDRKVDIKPFIKEIIPELSDEEVDRIDELVSKNRETDLITLGKKLKKLFDTFQ